MANKGASVAAVFSQDVIWLCLGLVVGFIVPFMVWLWLASRLSLIFLAQNV